jgi:hypothetical protein
MATEFSKMVGVPENFWGRPDDAEEMTRVGQALFQIRFPPDDQLRERAATVADARIAVLVVTGVGDPAFEATGAMAATLTNGRHQVIRSPHHFPHLVSGEFNDVLDAFMKDNDSRALK